MALVQMRTPGGSYSDVDEELVGDYQADGWVLNPVQHHLFHQ